MATNFGRISLRTLAPLLLMTACGDSSGGPAAPTTGDASAGAGGAMGSGGAAGASGGSGNTTSTEGGPLSCPPKLTSTDPGCPSNETDVVSTPNSQHCPTEGLVCEYQESTASAGQCAATGKSTYACCGGVWIGASSCPKPVPGQDAKCPANLPNDNSFNPAACSTSGLKCGYYPTGPQGDQQQDIACCPPNASLGLMGLRWRFCFPKQVQGTPTAPTCACP